jgi:ABC transport system ATP-binding/permease protein
MTHSFSEQTVVNINPFIELNNQGKISKFELTQDLHFLGRDPSWSTIAIPNDWTVISRRQAVIKREGEDYRIYDGDRTKPSGNGIFLDRTRINLSEGYLLKSGAQLYIGQDPRYQITITYHNHKSKSLATVTKRRLDLSGLQH